MSRKILHLLVTAPDSTVGPAIAGQKSNPQNHVVELDLNVPNPDYAKAVELIFESDSIQVW